MMGFNPVYWFFAFYLLSHPSLRCLCLAVLGTAIGTASFQALGLYCSRIRSAAELRRDERLDHGDLDPVIIGSLKGVIPEDLWLDIASARVENGPLWKKTPKAQGNEIYIFVYRPRSPGAPWTPGSAFLGSVGQRVAILRDDPLKAVRSWSRFLFLHELAHVSSEGVALHIARWRTLLTMLHAVVTVLVLSSPFENVRVTALLLLAIALSLGSFFLFERLCESYADASAFRQLPSDQDRLRVRQLMLGEVEAASRAFGDKHFHTRLWRARLDSLLSPRRFSYYNLGGGTIYDPSPLPFLLASVATSILAWNSTLPSSIHFWVYTSWCGCCQLGSVTMYLCAQYTDAGVRIALHRRIPASPTASERPS